MPSNGELLVDAIAINGELARIDNCPGVPAQFGLAIYGGYQDDNNPQDLTVAANRVALVAAMFPAGLGATDNVRVYHFDIKVTGGAIHHFAAVTWMRTGTVAQLGCTIYMAYEGLYKLPEYINGTGLALQGERYGYKKLWGSGSISTLLDELAQGRGMWERYFADRQSTPIESFCCYDYGNLLATTAATNLAAYRFPVV